MSWHDPKGPWVRAQRRRTRGVAVGVLGMVIVAAGQVGVYLWVRSLVRPLLSGVPGASLDMTMLLMLLLPVPLFAVLAVFLFKHHRRERLIAERVPQFEGLICPFCRTALNEQPAEGECPKCKKPYRAEELPRYWELHALAPREAMLWRLEHGGGNALKRWRASLLRQAAARPGRVLGPLLAIVLLFAVGYVALVTFLWRGTFVGNLLRFGPFMCFGAGIGLLGWGLKRRVGETRHCAACGYQQAPGVAPSQRCPECGARWSRPGGAVTGRLVRVWWPCVAGTVLILLYVASAGLPFSFGARSALTRLLPTTLLIEEVVSSDFADEQWAELTKRTLTPEQERRLAGRLFSKRLARGHLSSAEDAWFLRKMGAGTLPADLVERYYRGMLKVWIETPERARVGKAFQVIVGAEYRRSIGQTADVMAYVAGFYAGESSEPVGRPARALYPFMLEGSDRPREALTAHRPGPFPVRLVLWVVVGPGPQLSGPVTWQGDGTPVIPAAAVWSGRVEVERVVHVVE